MASLQPSAYPCPTHGVDLTSQVEAEVFARQVPVLPGRGVTKEERQEKPRRFGVSVPCPGDPKVAGSAGEAHRQRFQGVVYP